MNPVGRLKKKKIVAAAALSVFSLVCLLHAAQKTSVPVSFISVIISPDGQKIASAVPSKEGRQTRILFFDTLGNISRERKLPSIYSDPSDAASWSSDSQDVLIANIPLFSKKTRTFESASIYRVASASDESPKAVVTKSGAMLESPAASSDTTHLSYVRSVENTDYSTLKTVWVKNLQTGQEIEINGYRLLSSSRPQWSMNGQVVAFLGTHDASQQFHPPYIDDEKNPAITNGIVWATAKDGFIPHFVPSNSGFFESNSDGSQFAVIGGKDAQGKKHLLQVVDSNGVELAKSKRDSISINVAWNSTNSAIFFLDNFYNKKHLQLCRWDVKTGQVDVLQQLPELRGKILGYRNGTLFYTTATWNEENSCQINQLKVD